METNNFIQFAIVFGFGFISTAVGVLLGILWFKIMNDVSRGMRSIHDDE